MITGALCPSSCTGSTQPNRRLRGGHLAPARACCLPHFNQITHKADPERQGAPSASPRPWQRADSSGGWPHVLEGKTAMHTAALVPAKLRPPWPRTDRLPPALPTPCGPAGIGAELR